MTDNIINLSEKTNMEPIKTAIASYGMSGQVFHAPFIDDDPGFELYKVLQRSSDSVLQDYPNVIVAKTYQEILEDSTIELIIVNTPNKFHYAMSKQALEAGKHVLVEKPFTTNVEEAKELISIAKAKKLVLYPFHNRRWDSDFLTVKQLIKENVLGKINYYEANWDRYRNYINPGTWKESGDEATGMLYDLGSHLIDQILQLFGMPESIYGTLRINRNGGSIIDYFDAKLYYSDMEVAIGASYLARMSRPRFLIQGDIGSFVKYGLDPQEDALKQKVSLKNPQWGEEPENTWGQMHTEINGLEFMGKVKSFKGNYKNLFRNLYESIRENKPQDITPEQGLQIIQIIEAIVKSSKEGRNVRVD